MGTFIPDSFFISVAIAVVIIALALGIFVAGTAKRKRWHAVGTDGSETARITAAMDESENRYRLLCEICDDGILIVGEGRLLSANAAAAKLLGASTASDLVGREASAFGLDGDDARKDGTKSDVETSKSASDLVATFKKQRLVRLDGSDVAVEGAFQAVRYLGKPARQYVVRDTPALKAVKTRLATLSRAVDQSPASVFVTDANGKILYVNAKFVEGTGYTAEEALGRSPKILNSGLNPRSTFEKLWRTITAGEEWRGELVNKKKSGEIYWDKVSISPIKAASGAIIHFVAVQEDITTQKENEARLIHQANFDALTKLPNRILALDRLTQAIVRIRRAGCRVAVLFLDLDRFKHINDTFGHSVGDSVLRRTAECLRACVREDDTVARFGGDEFTITLNDLQNAAAAEVVAKKILEAFSQPFRVSENNLFVSASIGIALAPDDGEDAETLLRCADIAMYRAKELSRNAYQFFTPDLNIRMQRRYAIETQLRHATDRQQLTLHYQPFVDCRSGHVVGVEALMRWDSPELGSMSPAEFIPLAEESGQIFALDAWALDKACRQVASWRRQGMDLRRLAVNVSAKCFQSTAFVNVVRQALDDSGLPPDVLELEIAESVFVEDLDKIADTLAALNSLDVRISVDNFGTGYVALSYLRRFPIKTLKIDPSYIRDTLFVPGNARLVEAIIGLGHSLNLDVLGEGVETAEELDFLKTHGCDLVQGFYVGEPVPVLGDGVPEFFKKAADDVSKRAM